MEIKIVIDDRLVKPFKRLFSRTALIIVALFLALGSATYVYAVGSTPSNVFVPNTIISSSEVNQNFSELYAAVNALEQKHPAGVISGFAGSVVPPGFLLCDGAEISRTQYAALFAEIGITYGVGDGINTFNLPDLQGRVAVGLDPSQPAFDSLNNLGGETAHTLTTAEMPSHNHSASSGSAGAHTPSGSVGVVGNHGHPVSLAGTQSGGTTTNPSGHNIPYARNLMAGAHADGAFDEMRLWNGPTSYSQPPDWDFMPRVSAANVTSGAAGSHSHSLSMSAVAAHSHTLTTNTAGSGAAHNVLQPYGVVNYIIAY